MLFASASDVHFEEGECRRSSSCTVYFYVSFPLLVFAFSYLFPFVFDTLCGLQFRLIADVTPVLLAVINNCCKLQLLAVMFGFKSFV